MQLHFWRVFWRFIKAEIEELIFYVIAVLIFGITAFYQVVISNSTSQTEDISEVFTIITEKLQFITNGDDTAAKIFTFGLWFIIGTFVYALACFMVSFASGAFRDVEVSSSFIHPSSFHKSDFWLTIISRAIIRVGAAVSLLFYTAVWCTVLAPVWLASFKSVFIDGLELETLVSLIIAIVGIGLSLHIGAILLRLILLRSSYGYDR
jgi:hypothetical protein